MINFRQQNLLQRCGKRIFARCREIEFFMRDKKLNAGIFEDINNFTRAQLKINRYSDCPQPVYSHISINIFSAIAGT